MTDTDWTEEQRQGSNDIAIIGMSGRFPGAADLDAFWQNLRNGVESITFFSDEELRARGVPDNYLRAPNFIKASPVLEGYDHFDAAFFGYAPREAELLDPQHRLFLEQAWLALENAGYYPQAFPGMIGVFAGTSLSTYLLFNLLTNSRLSDAEHSFEIMIGNDKDFLSTRVSYHLNLRGPSLDVQTGCSTSLVATHLACEGLLSFQCDLALAGGVSVHVPQRTGYFYEEGGITSPDGHCRAFDAQGAGTLFGSGVGVVVLKRLEEAIADGDRIYAVIKSSAVNNDGSQKVGFTAPGVEGQTEVISRALALAGIEPESIGYVETHGTGTALGDPVEITALTRAFRAGTEAEQFCALGSVKTNIGHLDAAAGIAGLIKTVLSLQHGEVPPSLHFNAPNPKIDFAHSPFYVCDTLRPWSQSGRPRRAGVSSFGIGGTNAHLILEEAPALIPVAAQSRPWQMLLLSARTETALDAATRKLADFLATSTADLADIAYTLQAGRKRFPYRRALVIHNKETALAKLRALPPADVLTTYQEASDRPVVFMFPGGGTQYLNMGRNLYEQEPIFREAVDQCATILHQDPGVDLRRCLYLDQVSEEAERRIKETSLALPALFTISYATARLLMAWGIQPQAIIGHSMGEYVAACLAGVFSLADALAVVVKRGQLFEQLPPGAMLSIPLPVDRIRPLLDERLTVAAINGPDQCVVSGQMDAIEAFTRLLEVQQIDCRRLQINVAAHSPMVELIMPQFTDFIETLALRPPQIPFISNVTGSWITPVEATDPAYWGRQIRHTVRFSDGLATLLAEPGYVFLEVGPGHALSTLAKLQASPEQRRVVFSTIRHPYDRIDDNAFLLQTVARLWAAGIDIEWPGFYAHEKRRRIPLPAYPFERQRYWIEPGERTSPVGNRNQGKQPRLRDWFYTPTWQQTIARPPLRQEQLSANSRRWLLFDDGNLGLEMGAQLQEAGQEVVCVLSGDRFSSGRTYTIRPGIRADYDSLIRELHQRGQMPDVVIHTWSVGEAAVDFTATQEKGFYSLLYLVQAIGAYDETEPLTIWTIASGLHQVESGDLIQPDKATLLSPCKIIPQEYSHITCYAVDILPPAPAEIAPLSHQLLAEIVTPPVEQIIAWRGRQRWTQQFTPMPVTAEQESIWPLRQEGVYLITGGLGNIGLHLAGYLAHAVQARLVLLGRSALPSRSSWDAYLHNHDPGDPVAAKIQQVRRLEEQGAEVLLVQADVADQSQLQAAVAAAQAHFGALHGVIHAAGTAGEKTIKLIPQVDKQECEQHFQAKVQGTRLLSQVLQPLELDFVLLFSSNVSILGGLGAVAYAAANLFMDAFARTQARRQRWLSANWDGWLTAETTSLSQGFQTSIDRYAMQPQESVEAFRRLVTAATVEQVVVSTGHLPTRLDLWINRTALTEESENAVRHARPTLNTAYVPPENELETLIVTIWQELLGIEQLGVHDNFFDLGGNSLIALKVISRLKQALHIEIPVVSLFEGPTAHALVEVLNQQQNGQQPAYDASRSRGERRRQRHQRQVEYDTTL